MAPDHIAFIMDGNGRWAKSRNKERTAGHSEGAKRLREIIEFAVKNNFKHISFFAFGLDNWKRPKAEVYFIWNAVKKVLTKKSIQWLMDNNVRFRWIGFLDNAIPKNISKILLETMELTSKNTRTSINLFMNYSGRADIINAAKSFTRNEKISENTFNSKLLTSGIPDVDLLIRTSGEQRISNFMLWQISYAELIFYELNWPDFTIEHLIKCIDIFNKRQRRFGGLNENESH
ncbi:polyprenyl diphosphate synthase [Mycoplasmoides alvi]|uniref:polyprenyl diphosphate synthase n=1 Tax=Mycoplasmoides alvi TaxID=78580 RepID=UPI00051C55C9|nr:polyprenyl diphosphate synthase [Mycoplasmoides alvi]